MVTWLNLDELAKYSKTPKSTLYKLLRARKVPSHKLGRGYRFDRDEVDAWIKSVGKDQSGPARSRRAQ